LAEETKKFINDDLKYNIINYNESNKFSCPYVFLCKFNHIKPIECGDAFSLKENKNLFVFKIDKN
jgi:hypothetical protein